MGIVVTRPLNLTLGDVFDQLNLDDRGDHGKQAVLSGGPVSTQRGFVLHQSDSKWQSTIKVSDDIALTASRDIISALALGDGPDKALFALGYAGWGAGQLESEISENSWLIVPADVNTLFNTAVDERWNAATTLLGFDPHLIPLNPGHA